MNKEMMDIDLYDNQGTTSEKMIVSESECALPDIEIDKYYTKGKPYREIITGIIIDNDQNGKTNTH